MKKIAFFDFNTANMNLEFELNDSIESVHNVFEQGSTWLKADFHLHTRADKEFKYDGEVNDFVNLYVEKLANEEIGIGVITNHNKFDKNEFVALKKKANKRGIGLFPGVEYSLKEGIHILIVFDNKWYLGEHEQITKFLDNAFYGINNYSTPPYTNSRFDLDETVEALNEIGHDYFMVLAHVDDGNGLFQVLEKRTLDSFIGQDSFRSVLAVQKKVSEDNFKRLCEIANRELACVEGSDNAHAGIDGIGKGKRVTYVKVGDFSFEALKYSLTDHEYRVIPKEKPTLQNSFIKSIGFEGGLLDGKKINFSPELNNLIGIRGSGKSSILEILRYALDIQLTSRSSDYNYKNDLVEHVIRSGGKIVLELTNEHEEEYRIERIFGQKETIYKGGVLQHSISIDAFFKRPVYFGQKDLSNKDSDFEAELIQRLIGSKLKQVHQEIIDKESEIKSTILEMNKLKDLAELKKDTNKTIQDNEHKLQTYIEQGVEEKLKGQTEFETDISQLNDVFDSIVNFNEDVLGLVEEYQEVFSAKLNGSKPTEAEFNSANELIEELKTELDRLKSIQNKTSNIQERFSSVVSSVNDIGENLKEEFAKIKREINLPSLSPDNFLELKSQIQTATAKLEEIEKSELKRKQLRDELTKSLNEINELWLKEYRELEKEVTKINSAESKLRIEIKFKGNREKFTKKLREISKGANIYKTTFPEIVDKYADFIEIFKNTAFLDELLNENQLVDFKRKFSENLAELLTYKVENSVVIKYNGKPLKDHSLGQRASALILFLLAQRENDVLILDQPEDDLDNQTIYRDVIQEIRKLKGEMQFIFATHNANIPVLGDSEKVIACDYIENEEIDLQVGTIDDQQIQKRIVDVMEGGTKAFKLRKQIYELWNVPE